MAVLPFTTIGNVDAYLADGLTEAVTRELGHIEGTRVIASSAAFEYRGRSEGFAQIARELAVDVMVRGSVQRAGDRLRITAALLNAADDTILWSNGYERGAHDGLEVEDDIAWQVAAKLADTLGAEAPVAAVRAPRGRRRTRTMRFCAGSATCGGRHRDSATVSSSLNGPCRSIRTSRWATRGWPARTPQFFYNSSDPALERKAFVEIEKALAINPDLAEAYLARAQLTWNLRNGFPHERAIVDLRRAIENNPNLAEAHIEIGKIYSHIGLIEKSIAATTEALRLDPRSTVALRRLIRREGGRRAGARDQRGACPQPAMVVAVPVNCARLPAPDRRSSRRHCSARNRD